MKEENIMDQKSNRFLETEPIGVLMRKYSVPCIISLLVAALYNIVDQIFIANASYLGSYGNAANTVVFPLTVVSLAIAVMIGDGCCAFVSISLGAGKKDDAHKSIGSAVILCIICSVILTAVYLIFQEQILTMFGGRVNEETFRQAKEYFFWITVGIPFYMFGQAMNPIIRSDGSPKFAMISTLAGAFANIIDGVDGLIHISQIADRRIEKPQDVLKVGETVKAKITAVDEDRKRVSLSIRALIEDSGEESAEEAAADDAAAETEQDAE